ncbi:hypothetical protein GCM10009830_03160 [Glycomyces endophyticus]|uniref:Uncharacterized protein n=1 Tax=Glycomyces endophyticus TaxID=480996 RepID=A0ABN2FX30_9ACTN
MDADRTPRPTAVKLAAAAHFAVALAFASIPLVGLAFGADVQAAAEAEVARQGQEPSVLASNGLSFDEHGVAIWAPFTIAGILAVLGFAALAGSRIGRIFSWITLPLVLAANALIMASNATASDTLQGAFDGSDDAGLRSLDATALLDAAYAAYPDWLPALETGRLVIVLIGCVLGVVLLAARPAREYFRKQ